MQQAESCVFWPITN